MHNPKVRFIYLKLAWRDSSFMAPEVEGRLGLQSWQNLTPEMSLEEYPEQDDMRAQSHLTLCDPVDCTRQAPLSMEFSRQEYWSGLPFPTPADLPDPGIEPISLASPALVGGFFTTELPGQDDKMQLITQEASGTGSHISEHLGTTWT